MTIDQAIEILDLNLKEAGKVMPPGVKDAVSLAIEALKEVKESRCDPSTWQPKLLPGETAQSHETF